MNKPREDYYTYRVFWSEEDGEYAGLCAEFPSLSWLDADQDNAFRGIRKLVSDVVKDMEENREEIPEPLSLKKYSGRFSLRIPPEVHRRIAVSAAESGISVNRWINSKLV